jgi:hypothetical protein
MGSIPLPALDIRTQPTDPLEQLGRVQQLRTMAQQQQMQQQQMQYQQQLQPLQLQQEQQNVALSQQKVKDVQAGQAAYNEWDGKDYNDFARLIIKHGGSVGSANEVAMYGLQRQKELTDIAKSQSEADKNNQEVQKNNYDKLAGRITALNDLPDDQIGQGVMSLASDALRDKTMDQAHWQQAQQIANLPPAQIRQTLPNIAKWYQSESQQIENAQKQAATEKTRAETPGAAAESKLKQAQQTAYATWQADPRNQGKGYDDYQAETKGQIAGTEARARMPYEIAVSNARQAVENQFWNRKDAATRVETQVLKPYEDKMKTVSELNSTLDLAEQGNVAASRAVLLKMIGVSNPDGTKRYNSAEAERLARQGNIPEQFKGAFLNALTGNQWTPKMISDMRDYSDSIANDASRSANYNVDITNRIHGTSVPHIAPEQPIRQKRPSPLRQPISDAEIKAGNVAQGPKGQIVLRQGQWIDPATGLPPQ